MNKPEEYIYPFATALFVFGALSQTLFMPIIGGINGFAILFLLLVKFFVGKMREKATAAVTANLSASPAENSEEETGALSAASNLPT